MTAPETPPAAYNQIWTSLSDPRVENLAAQVMLYQSDRLADGARQSLERQFTEQSRAVLRRLLGCPPPNQFQPPSATVALVADPRRAAELLWGVNFATVVEGRLRAAEGSNRGLPLLSLACTIPCTAMRAAVLQSLEKYWEEGPKRFEPSIVSDESLPEPGFLLLVKQLPRKDAHAASPGGVAADRGGPVRSSAARSAKLAAARQIKERQNRIAQQWLAFSEKLVQAMCRQFWAAALARRDAVAHSESEDVASKLPIRLPTTANVVASHHVMWPEGVDGALAELPLASLRVHYARMEQKARPDKLLAYYRRQLPSATQHSDEHGVWLDDFSIDRKKGNARSVDVFISKPNRDVGILLGQEQQVIVELLTVECLPQPDN